MDHGRGSLMATALNRRQDAASPWAFVAFEAETTQTVWEAFEPEYAQETRFAPFEESSAEIPDALALTEQPVADDPMFLPGPQTRIEREDHEAAQHHEEQLRTLKEAHQQAIAEIEQKYAVEILGKLTSQLNAQSAELADEIGGRLTRLLAPLLMEHARKSSLAALTRDLLRILLSSDVNKIALAGPLELVTKIQAELGEHASRLQIEEADTVDVTVRIDSEVLATKLSAWTAVLKDVVA
jgi:hypothetical protein